MSSGRRAQSVVCVMKEERTVKVWSGTIKPVYYKARTLVGDEVEVADVGKFFGVMVKMVITEHCHCSGHEFESR